jgi:hypothetical protein
MKLEQLLCDSGFWIDVDVCPPLSPILEESHVAVHQREDRVVFPHPYIATRMKFGASLTHDDVASSAPLAPVQLDAQVLWIRVLVVLGRSSLLFRCKS